MAFPLSYRGKIECGSRADTAALLDSMSEELRKAGLQNVFVWGSGISFGGATGQYGIKENEGNKLTVINEGEIDISPSGDKLVVSYTLHFWGVAVASALFALGVFGLLCLAGQPPALPVRAALSAVLWLFTSGLGYLFATHNFESLIMRALDGV